MKTAAFRLKPGADLKQSIESYAMDNKISGSVITCVAGLESVVIRMAGATPDSQDVRTYEGKFEVVSLVGTLSPDGVHLHIAVSDKDGKVLGGHLKDGSIVGFTAEIVLGIEQDKKFSRQPDEQTGFDELIVED